MEEKFPYKHTFEKELLREVSDDEKKFLTEWKFLWLVTFVQDFDCSTQQSLMA